MANGDSKLKIIAIRIRKCSNGITSSELNLFEIPFRIETSANVFTIYLPFTFNETSDESLAEMDLVFDVSKQIHLSLKFH